MAILYCLIQRDLKMVIAYRRVGHMGLVLAGLAANNELSVTGSLLIMMGHGFARSGLFYGAYLIQEIHGSRSLSLISGMVKSNGVLCFLFIALLLCNISFPPTINFFGEFFSSLGLTSLFPCAISILILLVFIGGIFNAYLFTNVGKGLRKTKSVGQCDSKSLTALFGHLLPQLLIPLAFMDRCSFTQS